MNYKIWFWCAFTALLLSWCGQVFQARTITYQERSIQMLEAILDDPHHCVSVCQEEFAKIGC